MAAVIFAGLAPSALADECGSEDISGQSGPFLSGAGSHVYMLLSQYVIDTSGVEQHNLYDLQSNGQVAQLAAPFNNTHVRAAALATAGDRLAATWWTDTTGQQALDTSAGGALTAGAATSPLPAEVTNPYGVQTAIAVNSDGSGAIIDVNGRAHRVTAAGAIGPGFDAGAPTKVVINPNGTAWFAHATTDSKLGLYRWDAGAPAPVSVPVTLPFGFSGDFDMVADTQGGVRLLTRPQSGAGLIHVHADSSITTHRFNGIRDAQLDGRADGSFAVTTLKKKSGVRTLALLAGKPDDSLAKAVTVFKGRTQISNHDTALQPSKGALVSFDVNKGQGQLRVARVKGSKHGKPRTIKAKTSKTGFDEPQIATTTSGSAWVLFTAFDRRKQSSVCGKYVNFRYVAAKISASGKPGKPKSISGAHPLTYYIGS